MLRQSGRQHRPATDYRDAHIFVTAFVERRRRVPGSGTDEPAVTAASVYNLHHGRWRGLTWHDEDSDVVWLLGSVGTSRAAAATHTRQLKARDLAGT